MKTKLLLPLKNQKGMALIFVIFVLVLASYLVTEISYESNVEYIVNANAVHRVRAYYAAKSAVDISLLRIKLYTKIQRQFGSQIPPEQRQLLEYIWSFPLMWPPPLDPEAFAVERERLNDTLKETFMSASYQVSITDEGTKIDINDLNSPSKALRDSSRRLIESLFQNRMENDEAFARRFRDFRFEDLVNHLQDWGDEDSTALSGGDESQYYSDIKDPEVKLPPNRAFRTVDEVRLVATMTDELFQMLRPIITVYGMKAINPNTASTDLLKAIDRSMTDEIVSAVKARISDPDLGGPFKNNQDFWGFLSGKGANISTDVQRATPLFFEKAVNFKIEALGTSANTTRFITAYVFDPETVSTVVAEKLVSDFSQNQGSTTTTTTPTNNRTSQNTPLPKGPPRVVYFTEK